ncbi:MAG TPA: C40 family peptidase [Microbacteriaceae bacterium]|nr:C40 family peptidase [Microbacteriaceae bacterium]
MALFTRNSTTPLQLRIRRASVISIAFGLFVTLALPAYAVDESRFSSRDLAGSQAVSVEAKATVIGVSAESYASATAGQARREAAAAMAAYTSAWTGPTVEDLLANPPASSFDGASIYQTALSFEGVPYVYGGDTPAGFDCSGYVMYVFAMHGIALPHSSAGQGAMGTPISEADARPGDLVIMNGHDGFWAGPGLILHSPYPGSTVRVQSIWTDYTIVRLGI